MMDIPGEQSHEQKDVEMVNVPEKVFMHDEIDPPCGWTWAPNSHSEGSWKFRSGPSESHQDTTGGKKFIVENQGKAQELPN